MAERLIAALINGIVSPMPEGSVGVYADGSLVSRSSQVVVAGEDLVAGDILSFYNENNTVKVRKADASTEGKEAEAFTQNSATSGTELVVETCGINSGLSGLTSNTRYYLSTTPGILTSTPPSGSGNVFQFLGKSVSPNQLNFTPAEGITNA